MARKRGGLAGLYDRNKGFFKTAVPAALSFIPGAGIPLAAAAGAAFGGFDRPGKAGIGFDPFEGIKGGLQGLSVGTGTQSARALLTGGGPMAGVMGGRAASATAPAGSAGAAPAGAPNFKFGFQGIGAPLDSVSAVDKISPVNIGTQLTQTAARGQLPGIGMPSATAQGINVGGINVGGDSGAMDLLRGAGRKVAGAAKSAGKFVKENQDLIGMAGKGVLGALPNAASDAAMMNAETQRMLAEEQIAEAERERERRRRIAELLMPYAQGVYGSMGSRMNG